jgi:hypothetical protein
MKIKVLKNQGPFQTLENFQVLQTWIFLKSFLKTLIFRNQGAAQIKRPIELA